MDPLSPTDKVLAVLRQRLRDLDRLGAKSGPKRVSSGKPDTLARLKAVAGDDTLSQTQFRRKVVQDLLANQLGEKVLNEANFQAMVDRVTDALTENEVGTQLLDRVISDLRATA